MHYGIANRSGLSGISLLRPLGHSRALGPDGSALVDSESDVKGCFPHRPQKPIWKEALQEGGARGCKNGRHPVRRIGGLLSVPLIWSGAAVEGGHALRINSSIIARSLYMREGNRHYWIECLMSH